jgi:phage baseplate assembly protein W
MAQFNSKDKASRVARRWWTDIDVNMTLHPQNKDIVLKYDINAVKRSIKNLLLTNHYERLFKPGLGANFSSLLFENVDMVNLRVAEQNIKDMIRKFEPRAKLNNLIINPIGNSLDITILFTILNSPEPQELNLILERVR